MSKKNPLIDLLQVGFTLSLIAFFLFIFTNAYFFDMVKNFMITAAPVAVFSLLFLIKLKFDAIEIKERKETGDTIFTITLTCFDKLKSSLVIFSFPLIICAIEYAFKGKISLSTLISSILVFIIAYFWQRYIFNQKN